MSALPLMERQAKVIARVISAALRPSDKETGNTTNFLLVLFDTDEGASTYIGDAEREDVVKVFATIQEQLGRAIERKVDEPEVKNESTEVPDVQNT